MFPQFLSLKKPCIFQTIAFYYLNFFFYENFFYFFLKILLFQIYKSEDYFTVQACFENQKVYDKSLVE